VNKESKLKSAYRWGLLILAIFVLAVVFSLPNQYTLSVGMTGIVFFCIFNLFISYRLYLIRKHQ